MRAISKTNSNRRANSVAVYESYRDDPQNSTCELARYLGVTWRAGKYLPVNVGAEVDAAKGCHHIFSMGMRPHERPNLIRISHEAHDLVHNGIRLEPITIRLASIAAKCVKRAELCDPDEFNLETMRSIFGQSIAAWVERQKFTETWQRRLQADTLSRLAVMEREVGS